MSVRPTTDRIVILLVDDDPGDQELTRRALRNQGSTVELRVVSDGEEALEYLRRQGRYPGPDSAPRPDLILLDLNMPKMNGSEVLSSLRQDPDLSRIPVVVLTTSEQEADIRRSYDLGCNSFIHKPIDIERFGETIRKLSDYWFETVRLPTKDGSGDVTQVKE